MKTLFHYTSQTGLEGIVRSGVLWASTATGNPRDVRFGNGQYLTDMVPGMRSRSQTSRMLFGHPFLADRCSHFVEIDVTDLTVIMCRAGVFLIPNDHPLDLTGRLIRSGEN